jgi:hypothetical protein
MVSGKVIRQALYEKLNVAAVTTLLAEGSASLIYSVAPAGKQYPVLIFNKQSGTPTHQFGGSHFDSQIWLVKSIVKGGSPSRAEEIALAVSEQLDFQTLTISGASVMHLGRESDVDYTEEADGELYRHAGALYRLTLRSA